MEGWRGDVPEGNDGVDVQRAALAYPFVDWEEDDSAESQTYAGCSSVKTQV